ncbi:MAG: hypothetical protein J5793_04425, partial [Clostridia bacterium]|nr:hypothetical protein [Clostridia bacterium]
MRPRATIKNRIIAASAAVLFALLAALCCFIPASASGTGADSVRNGVIKYFAKQYGTDEKGLPDELSRHLCDGS